MKKDKSQKAITLIALIITIIILLILAGVTIITLTGENGLLNRAQIAKETNKNASINENTALNSYEDNIDNLKVDNSREQIDIRVKQNITITNMTGSTFKINVNSVDANNALKLYYYIDGKLVYAGNESTYTVTGLEDNSEHEVEVLADKNAMKIKTGDGDNVKTWLACIGNTDDITLDDVINNKELMKNLSNNSDARTYLSKSTEIIIPKIKEKVEEGKNFSGSFALVPTLSSNTNCLDSGNYGGFNPYYAFDKDITKEWVTSTYTNAYIGYDFNEKVSVYWVALLNSSSWKSKQCSLQYSDDNKNWYDASEIETAPNDSTTIKYISNTKDFSGVHQYWRVYVYNTYRDFGGFLEVQFYGV